MSAPGTGVWLPATTRTPGCTAGLYVFDGKTHPACPLCHKPYREPTPILNLYSSRTGDSFRPDGHRVTVYDGLSLYRWHANRFVFPNERLEDKDAKRMAYVQRHDGGWVLVNQALPDMMDVKTKTPIPTGQHIKLEEGAMILLEKGQGGRLIQVQLTAG